MILPPTPHAAHFEGNRQLNRTDLTESSGSSDWSVTHSEVPDRDGSTSFHYRFVANAHHAQSQVGVSVRLEHHSAENYILAPAALYNGNRFPALKIPYPPMLTPEQRALAYDAPYITDVPRLDVEGNDALVQFVSGDLAVPAVCVFDPERGRSLYILAKADSRYGIDLIESPSNGTLEIVIASPCVKQGRQFLWHSWETPSEYSAPDIATGDQIDIEFDVVVQNTPHLADFYQSWFKLWAKQAQRTALTHRFPLSAAWELYEHHLNRWQWQDRKHYYRIGVPPSTQTQWNKYQDFQSGWVGGGLNTFPALLAGTAQSQDRARRTLDFLTSEGQLAAGFYSSIIEDGIHHFGDDFQNPDNLDFHLARKSADVVVYLMREILLLEKRGETVPDAWVSSLTRACDAFAALWETYGQFGQFVGAIAGDIKVGGSASAVAIIGGLAWAADYTGTTRWLDIAKKAGEYYFREYLEKGLTNGGPGEILQCPDSESAYAFVESYMALYEVTGDRTWLRYCEEAVWQYSSWVMNTDFVFPETSTFGKLDLRTAGSVFANVQNKHSSPGICTFSGDAIFKLFRATGNPDHFRLIQLTVHNITQYFAREGHEIPDRDNRSKLLYPGMMSERVSTSDFEGRRNVGEVFFGQCWCSVSAAMSYVELPGIYLNLDSETAYVFDHVEAAIQHGELTIRNPTAFPAKVRILAERTKEAEKPLGLAAAVDWPVVEVPAETTITVTLNTDIEKHVKMPAVL